MRFFLLVGLCLFGVNSLTAQQTHLFVDETNVWYEYGGGGSIYSIINVHNTYFFDGDTTINGFTYQKMMRNRRDTTFSSSYPYLQYYPTDNSHSYGYYAAFRQDSTRVYYVLPDTQDEYLYADFNMLVGDTLKYIEYQGSALSPTVTAIDSIPFGSVYRKRFLLSNGQYFYEGIGCSFGIFKYYVFGVEYGEYLACFQQNGITQNDIYRWTSTPNCNMEVITSTEGSIFVDKFNVQIRPNPFSEYTILNVPESNRKGNYRLFIYDMQGRVVKAKTGSSWQNQIILERKNLSNGIYMLDLQMESGLRIKRKVMIK